MVVPLLTVERMSGLELSGASLLIQHEDLQEKEPIIRDSGQSISSTLRVWIYFLNYLEGNFSFVTVNNSVATNWSIFGFNLRDYFHQTSALADTAPVDTTLRQENRN